MGKTAEFLCLGYTCSCCQRVIAFRLPCLAHAGRVQVPRKPVTCPNGHVRWVALGQLAVMDHSIEPVEREELKTGT